MVSTSARDTGRTTGSIRNRNLTPAYTLPNQQIPRIKLSTQYDSPLESTLVPLARALFSFDRKLLRRVEILDQKDASCDDEARKKEALDRLEDIKELKRQWRDIDSFNHQFNQSYLTDGRFIPFWTKGLKHIRMVLSRKDASANHINMREVYRSIVWDYHECTNSLYQTLHDVVGEIALEESTLDLIRERWMKLDELFEWYFRVELGEEYVNLAVYELHQRGVKYAAYCGTGLRKDLIRSNIGTKLKMEACPSKGITFQKGGYTVPSSSGRLCQFAFSLLSFSLLAVTLNPLMLKGQSTIRTSGFYCSLALHKSSV